MKRRNVYAITENGETRYCETKLYGGLSGIALRFCLNARDEHGNARPFFDRLDRVVELSGADWRRIAGAPHMADDYYSSIEIDVDRNIVRADEDWRKRGERRYMELPLDKLLETAAPLIEKSRYSGYPTLDKHHLNLYVKKHFITIRREAYAPEAGEKPSVTGQLRAETPPGESHDAHERKAPELER